MPPPFTIRTLLRYPKASRPYASFSPADQPKKADKTTLYAALGIAAAAGGYWYYTRPEDFTAAKKKDEEAIRKAHESVKAMQMMHISENAAQDKLASARSTVNGKVHDAEGRARQVGADVQAKYDSYKSSAKDSTENLYQEARSTLDRKAAQTLSDAEKKGEAAKLGWFSWLGWGKSAAEKGNRETAAKVAEAAEDVRKRADKHT